MRAHRARVLGILVLTCLLALPGVAVADADYQAEGAESQWFWYGAACQIYSYDWTPPPPDLGPEKHVSSIYADGLWETPTRNYIELGLEQLATWGLPKQFLAYENYPRTGGQIKVRYGTQGAGTWVYCEINNHELGGSDWYAAINGTTVLRDFELINPSGGSPRRLTSEAMQSAGANCPMTIDTAARRCARRIQRATGATGARCGLALTIRSGRPS